MIYDTYVTKPKRTVSTASGRFAYLGPVYMEVGAGGGGGGVTRLSIQSLILI